MLDFAKLPIAERNVFLQETASRRGTSKLIVEKDFWVCFMLRVLFTLPGFENRFVFKGGTSLSKVYDIIKRFSEDIDISIDPAILGFSGNMAPEKAPSKNQFFKRCKRLERACLEKVKNDISPAIETAVKNIFGESESWRLEYEQDSRTHSPVVWFNYPTDETDIGIYTPPRIKLEFGSLIDQHPTGKKKIVPWVAENFSKEFSTQSCDVIALSIERTFWEKATILHTEYYRPAGSQMRARLSRDYYDVVAMSSHDSGKKALKNLDSLNRVVEYKKRYFPSSWASYGTAKAGTFHLIPPDSRLDDLKKDYKAMAPMFYESPPNFDELMISLKKMEDELNKS